MATEEQNPKITLHWLDDSRAQRIVWLLDELRVPYEVELYHRRPNAFAPASLREVHPLGKSPVVTIKAAGSASASSDKPPLVLAESGLITQYLCDHFAGKNGSPASLVPTRWKPGQEGQVGGETEGWRRFSYLLHYAEGTFGVYVLLSLLTGKLRTLPFPLRLLTGAVAAKLDEALVHPNARMNLAYLSGMLESAPEGGPYLCGKDLTAADILMSFPLIMCKDRFKTTGTWEGGSPEAAFPRVFEYVKLLEENEGYKRSVTKIEEMEKKNKDSQL